MSENTNDKKSTNEIISSVVDKASETGKKGLNLASVALSKTASGSKKLASGLAQSAKDFSEKQKNENYLRRIQKYNPLFPDEYNSADFNVPNIICIVYDAVRRDIDVCEGAIGWRENKKGTEVLFLYDEFISECGLTFVPAAICDEIYYIDSFDRKRFNKLDCIFQQAHDEKLAELEHIAYSLGAKYCSVEIEEMSSNYEGKKRSGNLTVPAMKKINSTENYESESVSDNAIKRYGKVEANFKGNDTVVKPTLKWFAHDNNILNLIEYRLNKQNEITSKTLHLSGSSSATLSRKAANSIDVTVASIDVKQSYAMEDKSVKENNSNLIFYIEF